MWLIWLAFSTTVLCAQARITFGGCCGRSHQPRRAALMAAMSIFFIVIIASKARFASLPPAASASVSARGVICQERPERSMHSTALAFRAAIADDRVPVTVRLLLILRRDLEGKGLGVPEWGIRGKMNAIPG
jgi:hypothetical protein